MLHAVGPPNWKKSVVVFQKITFNEHPTFYKPCPKYSFIHFSVLCTLRTSAALLEWNQVCTKYMGVEKIKIHSVRWWVSLASCFRHNIITFVWSSFTHPSQKFVLLKTWKGSVTQLTFYDFIHNFKNLRTISLYLSFILYAMNYSVSNKLVMKVIKFCYQFLKYNRFKFLLIQYLSCFILYRFLNNFYFIMRTV